MIIIRPIKIEDFLEFNKILKLIDAESDYMLFEANERQTSDDNQFKTIQRFIDDPTSTILVAENSDHKLAGYIFVQGFTMNKRKYCKYMAMGVLKEFQGMKVGLDLLKNAIKFCEEQNTKRLELTVVCENVKAVNLYKKFGFEIEGVKRASLFMNNRFVDEYYMSWINPEFY